MELNAAGGKSGKIKLKTFKWKGQDAVATKRMNIPIKIQP